MANFNRDPKTGIIFIIQTIDGKRFKASTQMKIDEKNWNGEKATNNLVVASNNSKIKVNSELSRLQGCLNMAIVQLTKEGGGMAKLKELYQAQLRGERTIARTGAEFMPYYNEYVKELLIAGKSSGLSEQTTYRRLERFFAGSNPTFNELDQIFYDKFTRWLEVNEELSIATISIQWKNIKHIMKYSFDRGIHKNTAYTNFKRTSEASDNIYLTKKEVAQIEAANLTGKLDKVRDWFLIQCYTGVAYVDIVKINESSIKNGIFSFRREKSDIICKVPIHPKVKAILKKYEGTLPKIYTNQAYNLALKEIASLAKITGTFTYRMTKGGKKLSITENRKDLVCSHTGRRTFATHQILDSTPVHLVMLMGGWKNLVSFDNYVNLRELEGEAELKKLKFFK